MSIFNLLFNIDSKYCDSRADDMEIEEENYRGVPLSALDDIANECRYGAYVTVSGDELYFHYKSGRGHQTNHAAFSVSNGKLYKRTLGGYPGQRYFPDVEFMNPWVNEEFSFDD